MRVGTIVLIVLVAMALISLGIRAVHRDEQLRPTAPKAGFRSDDSGIPSIRLDILNGTAIAGLAGEVASAVGRVSAIAGTLGNAEQSDLATSLLVNRRLDPEQALALASSLGGLPVVFEFDGRTSADAALILGADCASVLVRLGLSPP